MKENPLVSIIVPVFNSELYLSQCITSLINQTYHNLEIIVVDDGSTDNSPLLCDSFAQEDSRIKVFHKENEGVSVARNLGIKMSKGKYVGFVDSDDYVIETMVEKLVSAFEHKDNIAVVKCHKLVDVCSQVSEYIGRYNPNILEIPSNRYEFAIACGFIDNSVYDALYMRSLLENYNFPQGLRICEDLIFNVGLYSKLASTKQKLLLIPDRLYIYRTNPAGVCRQDMCSYMEQELTVVKSFLEKARERGILEKAWYIRYASLTTAFNAYLLKMKNLPNRFSNSERKMLSEIEYSSVSSYWGIRHKLLFLIVKYLPFLYKFHLVNSFCEKRGGILPPFFPYSCQYESTF